MRELHQWQQECRSIEDMRSNALDSLRSLEIEANELNMADKQLKEIKDNYNMLKGQVSLRILSLIVCLVKKCTLKYLLSLYTRILSVSLMAWGIEFHKLQVNV